MRKLVFVQCFVATVVLTGAAQGSAVTVSFTDDGTFTAPSFSESGLTVSATTGVGLLNLNGIGVIGGLSDSFVEPLETLTFEFPAPVVDVLLDFGPATSNFTMEYEAFNPASLGTVQINAIFQPFNFNLSSFFAGQPMTSFTMTGVEGIASGDRLGAITFTIIPEPSTLALAAFGLLGMLGGRRRRKR